MEIELFRELKHCITPQKSNDENRSMYLNISTDMVKIMFDTYLDDTFDFDRIQYDSTNHELIYKHKFEFEFNQHSIICNFKIKLNCLYSDVLNQSMVDCYDVELSFEYISDSGYETKSNYDKKEVIEKINQILTNLNY